MPPLSPALQGGIASTADYLLSFYDFLSSQRPPQNLRAGKRERVVCVAALCHQTSMVWLLRAWRELRKETEIAWKLRIGNRGLPPKLAGMASALSALPNDRMRNLACGIACAEAP